MNFLVEIISQVQSVTQNMRISEMKIQHSFQTIIFHKTDVPSTKKCLSQTLKKKGSIARWLLFAPWLRWCGTKGSCSDTPYAQECLWHVGTCQVWDKVKSGMLEMLDNMSLLEGECYGFQAFGFGYLRVAALMRTFTRPCGWLNMTKISSVGFAWVEIFFLQRGCAKREFLGDEIFRILYN